jgi:hypothetical protein
LSLNLEVFSAESLWARLNKKTVQKSIDFDFTTCVQPDIAKLENAYGSKIASVIKKAERINILDSLED